ncbi:alpha-galactosidase [Nonomuraea sp. NPDC050536]|uniref:alpha-galactosidase n=1 Tax=Nonomuraea sp. NPDC050536 TaxID=3364366 RepID=UPI0037CC960F
MSIVFDARDRLWLLRTPATSYVLRLDEDDAPRHVHWGARLTLDQARQLAEVRATLADTESDPGGEELAVEGGLRYGVPSLIVRYGDATRGVEWRLLNQRIDDGRLEIVFTDRRYPLEITLHYRVREDSDAIERHVTLRHTGQGPSIEILRLDSAAWTLPPRPGYRLSHVVGEWGKEFQLQRGELARGETTLTSRAGITGHASNPWLMVDAGEATEEHGEVWSAALAWSGSWRITAFRDQRGWAGWSGGFGHEGLTWRLAPGDVLETPAFAGLYSAGGFGATSRGWHDHVRKHVLPAPDRVRPVVYNAWEATEFDYDEALQLDLAGRAARLGIETFVMDDAWFGTRTHDAAGLGDWWPNPGRFPKGLGPLIDEVRGLGMDFGIWVEPEAVNPDSDLYRRHPDWVLHTPGRRRTESRNQLVLNLARRDVAEWTHAWLDALVGENEISFLKWDMNRSFSEAGWPGHDDPDRLWIDHVRNVYAIIDRLRADHPGLFIEGCAGGGGRVDLGMLARVDQMWTSDNTDAAERVAIQHGYGQIYPACTMGAWVTDSPNSVTARSHWIRYRFHVSMAGALGVGGDLRAWSEDDLTWAAAFVEQYKQARPVIHGGAQYRLGPEATQYVSTDGREIVVLMYLPSALGRTRAPLRLTGLDPAGRYRDQATGDVHHGAVLLAHGIGAGLMPFDGTSEFVHLTRVD